MIVEIDIPYFIRPGSIPAKFMSVVIEQVLKSVNPELDFMVTVNFRRPRKLVVSWKAVN